MSYVYDPMGVLSQTGSNQTLYLLKDVKHSTRLVTNASGSMTSTYYYNAFGELQNAGTLETKYLYTGQQFDESTGLYSLRARYYNPAEGRFQSRDTWAYNMQNPIELNRYVYTANNPVNWSDPSGWMAVDTSAYPELITEDAIASIKGKSYGICFGSKILTGG
jgi:RHS repeat-associated protein